MVGLGQPSGAQRDLCCLGGAVSGLAKLQVTQLLFPQLQAGTRFRTLIQEVFSALNESIFAWPIMLAVLTFFYIAIRAVLRAGSFGKGLLKVIQYGAIFILLCVGLAAIAGTFRSITYAPQVNRYAASEFEADTSLDQGAAPQSMPAPAPYSAYSSLRSKGGVYDYHRTSGRTLTAQRTVRSLPARLCRIGVGASMRSAYRVPSRRSAC